MDNLSKENCITIKRFCEVTGFATETVRDNIKRMYPDLMQHGKTTFINQEQITRLQDEIMSHHNLADTRQVSGAKVKTQLKRNETILQAIQYLTEDNNNLKNEIEAQSKQLIEQAPKVKVYNDFIENKGYQSMSEVSKVIGMGRNKLFLKLRILKILQSGNNKNTPYQKFIKAGYFVVKEFVSKDIVKAQTFVTPSGMVYIKKIIGV